MYFVFGVAGAPLLQILVAVEWRSQAFMEYLDNFQLETDVVVQAHVGESEDEGVTQASASKSASPKSAGS